MSEHFIGEIELESNQPETAGFSYFTSLPQAELISKMAEKHRSLVEIMPYQRESGSVKLLVSVYLKTSDKQDGRVIIVLLRENYPTDVESLIVLIRTALTRLRTFADLNQQFDADSIVAAEYELDQMLKEF